MDDLFSQAKKPKLLTKYDVPRIKHMCIFIYCYDWWKSVGLKELFEQLPLIQKEYNRMMYDYEVQKCIAKSLGVKMK